MNKPGNKRFKDTEEKIYNAFSDLLAEKRTDRITVNDICRASGISRPSFYSHYADINDLILRMEKAKGIQLGAMLISSSSLTLDTFILYCTYLQRNINFYIAYFNISNTRSITSELMDSYVAAHPSGDREIMKYKLNFFMAGLKSSAQKWLLDGCPIPAVSFAQILYSQYRNFAAD